MVCHNTWQRLYHHDVSISEQCAYILTKGVRSLLPDTHVNNCSLALVY